MHKRSSFMAMSNASQSTAVGAPYSDEPGYFIKHLNDPNLDLEDIKLEPLRPKPRIELDKLGYKHSPTYAASEVDTESHVNTPQRYSDLDISPHSSEENFNDQSLYPEVRAAVSSVDDPDMPVNTFRMWSIGLLFTLILPCINSAMELRYPSLYISSLIIQLITLPFGKALERILPTTRFNTFGYIWSLNPGPFNIKEHVCITVMTSVATPGYATDVILAQRIFYQQTLSFGYQLLLVLGVQAYGFSLAGILRQYVVWPPSMIWPGAIVNCALFNTLHRTYGHHERGGMTRERFFLIFFVGSLVYYFIPGYLFTALSVFNWICWIVPNNVTVNSLFGAYGLGMSVLTFDWTMISYLGSPLVTPWWSEANVMVSFVLFFWLIAPIMYFSNTLNTAYMPISSYYSYDNQGSTYNASLVITDGILDYDKYQAYSPIFLPATLCLAYGLSFAMFPAVVVHTFLWFRQDIIRRFRSSLKDERDVHSRLMQAYPEVPRWWYAVVGVLGIVFLFVAIEIFPTQLPIWAALIAILFSAVTALPLAMIHAVSNMSITFNVMCELIAGYMLPGKAVANVIFKSVGVTGAAQAATFSGDLKLGHYMKIPPRTMFSIQVVSVIIAAFVSVGTQNWMFANIEDLCSSTQKDGFVCPSSNTFATASFIWGGIGPSRVFSPGTSYNSLLWFFLLGALLPIPCYYLARRFPRSSWRYVNIPVFFAGSLAIPPASGMNYASWALIGFIFNFYIRRRYFRWWMRYNYVLSAALDAGTAVAIVLLFLCLQLPKGGIELKWWGNTVWQHTADNLGTPLKSLDPGETFGPSSWS
ncbi:OPT oligopeptide transporter [Armillaria solidipes]|uniref:OPT oligopeptide transporter n=1 Tax=Armillaria solidipes TaxID=1076256 RepID=A0A2H3BSG2_9AGAR|nr:OPT oligopeptide transporter [Armillaria solidipes]